MPWFCNVASRKPSPSERPATSQLTIGSATGHSAGWENAPAMLNSVSIVMHTRVRMAAVAFWEVESPNV